MVDVEMFRKLGDTSVCDVVEKKGFSTAVGANETSSSAVSFQDQISVFEKDLVTVWGLHGESLNFNTFWERLP
jgi:hypothetical protein